MQLDDFNNGGFVLLNIKACEQVLDIQIKVMCYPYPYASSLYHYIFSSVFCC